MLKLIASFLLAFAVQSVAADDAIRSLFQNNGLDTLIDRCKNGDHEIPAIFRRSYCNPDVLLENLGKGCKKDFLYVAQAIKLQNRHANSINDGWIEILKKRMNSNCQDLYKSIENNQDTKEVALSTLTNTVMKSSLIAENPFAVRLLVDNPVLAFNAESGLDEPKPFDPSSAEARELLTNVVQAGNEESFDYLVSKGLDLSYNNYQILITASSSQQQKLALKILNIERSKCIDEKTCPILNTSAVVEAVKFDAMKNDEPILVGAVLKAEQGRKRRLLTPSVLDEVETIAGFKVPRTESLMKAKPLRLGDPEGFVARGGSSSSMSSFLSSDSSGLSFHKGRDPDSPPYPKRLPRQKSRFYREGSRRKYNVENLDAEIKSMDLNSDAVPGQRDQTKP